MQERPTIAPDDTFRDPRGEAGFDAACWPLLNGSAIPTLTAESSLHERRCVELLASYYRINRCNAALLQAREANEAKADKSAIDRLLDQVDQVLQAHDALEDRYAPIGFYGEPEMEDVFYRNINVHQPGLPRLRQEGMASVASAHVQVPGLAFIPASEWKGRITIERWQP